MRLRHLPVATKITIALTAILALMGGAGVVATVQTANLSSDVKHLTEGDLPLMRAAYELEARAGDLAATTAVYANTGEAQALQRHEQRRAEFAQSMRTVRSLATTSTPPLQIQEIEELGRRLDSVATAVVTLGATGETSDARERVTELARVRLALTDIIKRHLQQPTERHVVEALAHAAYRAEAQVVVTTGLLIVALLISAIGAERLADEINEPLRKLVRAASDLSTGKLGEPVHVDSSREFNALASAFNRMAQRLDQTVRDAHDSAGRAEVASAAKSAFVTEVSHDLRTPLTSLRGSLILLSKSRVDPASEGGSRMLQVALSSTERLIRLINDRLDIDRIEAGQLALTRETLPPEPLLEDALLAVRPLAEERRVALEVVGSSPAWFGDHDRLVQVVVNLIANAVSFSPYGETVRVQLSARDGAAKVEIIDRGPGIPFDKQKNLFRPYTQAHKRRPGGTGLGLAIAKGIIEQHGGQIGLQSEPSAGATFWFTVPLAAAGAPAARPRPTPVTVAALP